jgi:hypothetical protein
LALVLLLFGQTTKDITMTTIRSTSEIIQQIVADSQYTPTAEEVSTLTTDGFDPSAVAEKYQQVHDRLVASGLDAGTVSKFDASWTRWAADVVEGGAYDVLAYSIDQRTTMAGTLGQVDGSGLAVSALMTAAGDVHNIAYAPDLVDAALISLGNEGTKASSATDTLIAVLTNPKSTSDMIDSAMYALSKVGSSAVEALPHLAQFVGVGNWSDTALDSMACVFDNFLKKNSSQSFQEYQFDNLFAGMNAAQESAFCLHYLAMVENDELPARFFVVTEGSGTNVDLDAHLAGRVLNLSGASSYQDGLLSLAKDGAQPEYVRRDAMTVAGDYVGINTTMLADISAASASKEIPASVRTAAARAVGNNASLLDGYIVDAGPQDFPAAQRKQIETDLWNNINRGGSALVAESTETLVAMGHGDWGVDVLTQTQDPVRQLSICEGLYNAGYYSPSETYAAGDPRVKVEQALLNLITPQNDGSPKLNESLLAKAKQLLGLTG